MWSRNIHPWRLVSSSEFILGFFSTDSKSTKWCPFAISLAVELAHPRSPRDQQIILPILSRRHLAALLYEQQQTPLYGNWPQWRGRWRLLSMTSPISIALAKAVFLCPQGRSLPASWNKASLLSPHFLLFNRRLQIVKGAHCIYEGSTINDGNGLWYTFLDVAVLARS